MRDYPKKIKRQIRILAGILYERELNQELKKLEKKFSKWKKGKLSPFELTDKIHKFHQNPSRQLYLQYHSNSMLDLSVAAGIANGMIKPSEVPSEVMEALKGAISFQKNIEIEY